MKTKVAIKYITTVILEIDGDVLYIAGTDNFPMHAVLASGEQVELNTHKSVGPYFGWTYSYLNPENEENEEDEV